MDAFGAKVEGGLGRPVCVWVEVSGVGTDYNPLRGPHGCWFRWTLSTALRGVLGVVDAGVASRCVCSLWVVS